MLTYIQSVVTPQVINMRKKLSHQSHGDSDHVYRSPRRYTTATAHYSRSAPYGYYEDRRQNLSQQYIDHYADHSHAAISNGEMSNQEQQQERKRIAVAVRMQITSNLWTMTDALIVPPLQKTQDQVFWRPT